MRLLLTLIVILNHSYSFARDTLVTEKDSTENELTKISEHKAYQFDDFTDTTLGIMLEMVAVKGGTYPMGSNNKDEDERPVHNITVSSFYIGKYEVTQEQWEIIMDNNLSCKNSGTCPKCPIECISWLDAQEFIKKLNLKTGKNYRLPTEAEWEYAAGGGETNRTIYAGTNNVDSLDMFAWYFPKSNPSSSSVGLKQPNQLNLYDISGNIYEWVSDWYKEDYYLNSIDTDPTGPKFGTKRVIKGGSYGRSSSRCRVANRDFYSPANSYDLIGFRLALPAE